MRLGIPLLVACSSLTGLRAIEFDPTSSSWFGITSIGDSYLPETYPVPGANLYTGILGAEFHGALYTVSSGSTFFAALCETPTYTYIPMLGGGPLAPTTEYLNPLDFDLTGTSLATSQVDFTFTGLSAAPSYVVVMGGAISSYSYSAGALTLTASAGSIASTVSNPSGGAGFGVIISTDPSFNYGGAVFSTNASLSDLAPMVQDFQGSSPTVGLNVNGINGMPVSFDLYLTLAYLASVGADSPDDARAYVQKEDAAYLLPLLSTLYLAGYDPDNPPVIPGVMIGGQSAFDLDGGGVDDMIKATYVNSSWSSANIGITVVPEPSTYGLAIGGLALAVVALRRRSKVSK